MKIDTSVKICGVKFTNPVIAASGTFGFGREYSEYTDLNKIGGISVKGLTVLPREGNKAPRIVETPSGILNSVGLENPGIEKFIKTEIDFLRQYKTKIIVNVAGSSLEDYIKMVDKLNDADVDILEINVSCPNVKEGCVAFGRSESGVYDITKKLKSISRHPLVIKLTPNVSNIALIAKAAQEANADGISLINTLTGMVIDVNTKRPILANNTGGLSGPAIRPVAVRMTYEVAQAISIPIIGMGGITCANDALEFIIAGADAVMVGTYNFMDPNGCNSVAKGIKEYMIKNNINNLKEIKGSLILNK